MLYKIKRRYINGSITYEYLFGTRTLGKRIFSLMNFEDMEILEVVRLHFSFKVLKICLRHIII